MQTEIGNKFVFTFKCFEEYKEWQTEDRKTLKRINRLIEETARNPLERGTGKAEKLKGYKDVYSKRIDDYNRLVYHFDGKVVSFLKCKGHY